MARRHKDLEFHVSAPDGRPAVFKSFGEAAERTVAEGAGRSPGEAITIDVVTWSRGAAVAWAGDLGGEMYDEDPEASVFERIEVRARSLGRIP